MPHSMQSAIDLTTSPNPLIITPHKPALHFALETAQINPRKLVGRNRNQNHTLRSARFLSFRGRIHRLLTSARNGMTEHLSTKIRDESKACNHATLRLGLRAGGGDNALGGLLVGGGARPDQFLAEQFHALVAGDDQLG